MDLQPQDLTDRQLEAEIRTGLGVTLDRPWSEVLHVLRGYMTHTVAFGAITPENRWLAQCEVERFGRELARRGSLGDWDDSEVAA